MKSRTDAEGHRLWKDPIRATVLEPLLLHYWERDAERYVSLCGEERREADELCPPAGPDHRTCLSCLDTVNARRWGIAVERARIIREAREPVLPGGG